MNPIIPKGTTLVAEGEGYMVLRYDDEELGIFYILKGFDATDYVFNRQEWDHFAKFVAYADLKIRAVVE